MTKKICKCKKDRREKIRECKKNIQLTKSIQMENSIQI